MFGWWLEQAAARVLLANKSVRDAFLKLPREVDGTVQRDAVEHFMHKTLPKEDAAAVMDHLRDGNYGCACVKWRSRELRTSRVLARSILYEWLDLAARCDILFTRCD